MTPEFEERLILAILSAGYSLRGPPPFNCKEIWTKMKLRASEGDIDMAAAVAVQRAQARAAYAVCHAQASMIC